jgi:hypothetical protein
MPAPGRRSRISDYAIFGHKHFSPFHQLFGLTGRLEKMCAIIFYPVLLDVPGALVHVLLRAPTPASSRF